jgi:hypothetical protein
MKPIKALAGGLQRTWRQAHFLTAKRRLQRTIIFFELVNAVLNNVSKTKQREKDRFAVYFVN